MRIACATPRSPTVRACDMEAARLDAAPNTARPACWRGVRGLCTAEGRLRRHCRPIHR